MTKKLGAIGASLENKVRTTEFIAAARHLLIGKSHFAALVSARENRATPGVIELLQKAPVLPATTTDSTWAGPLAPTPAAAAFLETLRDVSAFDRILPNTLRDDAQWRGCCGHRWRIRYFGWRGGDDAGDEIEHQNGLRRNVEVRCVRRR